MNISINHICYLLLTFAILYILFSKKIEGFVDNRRRPKYRVQIGTLNNSPKEVKSLMIDLNKTGGQMKADTEYDTVDENYLDEQ